jgi:hypothetical protein
MPTGIMDRETIYTGDSTRELQQYHSFCHRQYTGYSSHEKSGQDGVRRRLLRSHYPWIQKLCRMTTTAMTL